jgi:hypothetical protein
MLLLLAVRVWFELLIIQGSPGSSTRCNCALAHVQGTDSNVICALPAQEHWDHHCGCVADKQRNKPTQGTPAGWLQAGPAGMHLILCAQ